jgi:hypothetical protein
MTDELRQPCIPYQIAKITRGTAALDDLRSTMSSHLVFFNGLSKAVTIVYRNGMSFTVPPSYVNRFPRAFVIRTRYNFGRDVIADSQGLFHDPESHWTDETRVLESALAEAVTRNVGQSRYDVVVDYAVSKEDIDANRGSFYSTQMDLVISTQEMGQVPLHPYSMRGSRHLLLQNDPAVNPQGNFSFRLVIVDHEGRYGRKFINIAGEVYVVKSIVDSELADGVYVVSSGPVSDVGLSGAPRCIHLTYEQASERLNLYNSVEEASTLGNPKALDDRLARELAADARQAAHDSAMRKLARESELDDLKHAEAIRLAQVEQEALTLKETLQREKHRRDMESMYRKDQYEERSSGRRDYADLLKYTPVVMTALGSLLLVIFRSKGK